MPDGGDVDYYVNIARRCCRSGLGELEAGDVTVTNSYETAVASRTGELNTQMAFMTGKLKVSGEMAKLMLNIAAITELTNAMSEVDTEY